MMAGNNSSIPTQEFAVALPEAGMNVNGQL
jgi:hypothetical protein